jgi:hypothetical protein
MTPALLLNNFQSTGRKVIVITASSLIFLPAAQAEVLLDLRFDDPGKLLEGMENSTRVPAGLAKPISECSELGVGILPEGMETIVSTRDSHYVFRGALDFFLRVKSEGEVSKFALWGWVGPLNLVTTISKPEDGLFVKAATNEALLRTPDRPELQRSLGSKVEAPIPFELGDVMHVALVFETDEEGMTTIGIHLQKGTGPMEVNSGTLNAVIGPFLVPASAPSDPKARFSLKLSREEASQSLDVYRFRIFGQPPAVFPGLE